MLQKNKDEDFNQMLKASDSKFKIYLQKDKKVEISE